MKWSLKDSELIVNGVSCPLTESESTEAQKHQQVTRDLLKDKDNRPAYFQAHKEYKDFALTVLNKQLSTFSKGKQAAYKQYMYNGAISKRYAEWLNTLERD